MDTPLVFEQPLPEPSPSRARIRAAYLADEAEAVEALLAGAKLDETALARIEARARRLVEAVRAQRSAHGVEALLREYDLSSREGVVLLCLAEALLRIPDATTADRLIRDRLSRADWKRHLKPEGPLWVNASTWGLLLTGRVMRLGAEIEEHASRLLERLMAKGGEALARAALKAAMAFLASHFVMGKTIEEALERGRKHPANRYSFDMLGEAALTREDAQRYYAAYTHAVEVLAGEGSRTDIFSAPGISVKLSALYPRYEYPQRERVLAELVPRLVELLAAARAAGIQVTLDAEEAERLELMLDVFEAAFRAPALACWDGFGLAVQAYQKRAPCVIDWLVELARSTGRRIPLRLVKGAYWDAEVKRAQQQGLAGYPVYTRKRHTDVAYLACARRVLAARDAFYPQFATHNANTIGYLLEVAGEAQFEFQRLHGMGEALYRAVAEISSVPCRVYAPVGEFDALLPYLVRRLLENGANTSFVNQVQDERVPVERVIADPVAQVERAGVTPNPRIPLPIQLYGDERQNSRGISLGDPLELERLAREMTAALTRSWEAAPLVGGLPRQGEQRTVTDPADRRRVVGQAFLADESCLEEALEQAHRAHPGWNETPASERAQILERAADLLEARRGELVALLVREGGKTLADAVAEVREAADHCRYYAHRARRDFAAPQVLPGPTGEENRLGLNGRGVFACISPWNFPLAIFTGQVAAALAAGNTVVAKPASATPLVAMVAVRLLHEAGVPEDALHLLPARGGEIGNRLLSDSRVAGVAFTGSTDTAWDINRRLAARAGPIVPFIAETGGQNAMIVDSSALPEQVVIDVLQSAFNSAGQRCSALRVLFLQEEIAPRVIAMLKGAMAELVVGDPALLATDVGPVIDEAAVGKLKAHCQRLEREGKLICAVPLPPDARHGSFFPPHAFEIPRIEVLEGEVFGPVLHVVRWQAGYLDCVIDAVNSTGYGLTLGVHSRIEETIERIARRARVGNLYANRNMIGAVVGAQPFGGEGLSGTGPKAGGPHYLLRFAVERTVSVNTAALGGNAALLALDEDE